ncbi:MAG: reverse transcriptase domain-containing protein, partial [Bacteriovoracia bacterium]
IFTLDKIHKAYNQCLKNKKNTANALKFEMQKEKNLYKLVKELKERKYKISRHICFIVTEPSPREIFASDFRDRVVHHLLCNEIESVFEKEFINNSYANRKNKGTHKAVKQLKRYVVRGGVDGNKLYYLKLDIKGFFRNIDKQLLFHIIVDKITSLDADEQWKSEVLWLTQMIIKHDPCSNYYFKSKKWMRSLVPIEKSLLSGEGKRGLPIGNLTSQFFANIYLNQMDHFIYEDLGFERYIRYVDDFIILDESKEKLISAENRVRDFIEDSLVLKLCDDKTQLRLVEGGVDFLGYYVKPSHTLVRNKVVKRFKKKIYQSRDSLDGLLDLDKIPMIQSYKGHCKHAYSYNLLKKLL